MVSIRYRVGRRLGEVWYLSCKRVVSGILENTLVFIILIGSFGCCQNQSEGSL